MFRKHYNLNLFDSATSAKKKMRDFRRGYLIYKKNDEIYLFRKIKGLLNQKKIYFDKLFLNLLLKIFPEFKNINFDLNLSQFIFQKSRIKRIYLDMLICKFKKKKICQFICKEYSQVLEQNNYKVSKISHLILWPLYCLLFWCYGNYIFLLIIIKSIRNFFRKDTNIDQYFFGITSDNLPIEDKINETRESYDLISWFSNYFKNDFKNDKKIIAHDNKNLNKRIVGDTEISFLEEPWYYINGPIKLFFFCIVGFLISITSLFLIFFNKWSAACLLSEILKAISVIFSNTNKISNKYLFHFSETIYRPLWTYILENNKVDIICYFYSAFDHPTNKKTNEIGHTYEYGNMSWSKIFVWDEIQKNKISKYVRDDITNIEIINTGPIWFTDSNFVFNNKKEKIIIFDMTVHRKSVHYGFYDTAEYTDLIDRFNCIFLNDIFNTFKSSKYEIILKRKRPLYYQKTNYKKLVEKLRAKGLVSIEKPVSPYYLLKNSKISISTPFTSANLYLKDLKNNFYYDPIKQISKNDIASRKLPIISGIEELNRIKNKLI